MTLSELLLEEAQPAPALAVSGTIGTGSSAGILPAVLSAPPLSTNSSETQNSTFHAVLTAGDAYQVAFSVAGETADLGDLRIVVQGRNEEMVALAEWQGRVDNGDTITLDLGSVSDSYDMLDIVVQRSDGTSVDLSLSDLTLSVLARSVVTSPLALF